MKIVFDKNTVFQLKSLFRFQWEETQQNYVLLYPEGMIKLNTSASEILKLCDGTHNANEIIKILESQFPGVDLKAEILNFLEDAHDRGWITAKEN